MARQVCIIGGGVIGLASAYALVRAGYEVTVIDARDSLGSETSFANGGQLSYRYVAPLADAGVPLQAIGWLLRGDSPLKLRPRLDPQQWRWMAAFLGACRGSVNQRNAAHLLRLASLSQTTLQQWREDDRLDGFDWRRNGKLVTFRNANSFEHARSKVADILQQQVLSAADCASLEPALAGGGFVGGIYTPNEEVADCHAFCQRLAARLPVTTKAPRYPTTAADGRMVRKPFSGADARHAAEPLVLTPGWNMVKDRRPRGWPVGVTVASDGSIWIADDHNGAILRLAADLGGQIR